LAGSLKRNWTDGGTSWLPLFDATVERMNSPGGRTLCGGAEGRSGGWWAAQWAGMPSAGRWLVFECVTAVLFIGGSSLHSLHSSNYLEVAVCAFYGPPLLFLRPRLLLLHLLRSVASC